MPIPLSHFQYLVRIETRIPSASSNPLGPSTVWTLRETAYCAITLHDSQIRDFAQEVISLYTYTFHFQGRRNFPAGSTRIVWEGKYYEPIAVEHSGTRRWGQMTSVNGQLTTL